ncbi:mediator of RNA polymerase II transcription subunit 4 [Scheffersomyces xylosifermentans]|uniref:mediator of RNA polymerase II transcription subunit 4 n=1 Tax=Scheffersomyces xylosifermentans TaxID=1304137 RepID=UPI00315D5057
MLPHKKNDSNYKSLPVSRVSSSSRLNQLPQHNYISSIPTTPNANYVSSSLNPIRNLPVNSGSIKSKITTKAELDKFEQLPIVKQVGAFETTLTQISSDISSFKDSQLHAKIEKIIAINDDLKTKIDELARHKHLGEHIKELETESKDLDEKSKYILKELIAFRNELKALPRLPAAKKREGTRNGDSTSVVQIEDVLKYAMKLAKFTKAPATSANMPFQIHPNNYVWPAEDALRRGMLAASSLQPDVIIQNELGTSNSESEEAKSTEETEGAAKEEDLNDNIRRGSFGEYGSSSGNKKNQEEQTADLNLDLFDPEDEYSD